MLFSSFEFLFGFLPLVVAGFLVFQRWGTPRSRIMFLLLASLAFYGWWQLSMLALLIASFAFNYVMALWLTQRRTPLLLGCGIACNLLVLGYFKYAGFFIDSLNLLAGTSFAIGAILLPLAISFHTFQQIAYLVDVYRGEAVETGFFRYALFVTFFPQLIAGPIVHHKELLPQLDDRLRISWQNASIGLTFFVVGLMKKVGFADPLGSYADLVFEAARFGDEVTFVSAWAGVTAFTLQIYFDFSGYSDMAIGLARLFGIQLPINFNSPYKARSIIDFWRRWHITLSRFLRDYLYVPLGGNRRGELRRYGNLMIVMVLGGLWHGAAWTFVAWGALHGMYLIVNHGWRAMLRQLRGSDRAPTRAGSAAGWALTIIAVMVAWVFFRAQDWASATLILKAMTGLNGIYLPESYALRLGAAAPLAEAIGVRFGAGPDPAIYPTLRQAFSIAVLGVLVAAMPNTQQWMARAMPVARASMDGARWLWQPSGATGAVTGLVMVTALALLLQADGREFIYFQF